MSDGNLNRTILVNAGLFEIFNFYYWLKFLAQKTRKEKCLTFQALENTAFVIVL